MAKRRKIGELTANLVMIAPFSKGRFMFGVAMLRDVQVAVDS
jgi:hypothetical protein